VKALILLYASVLACLHNNSVPVLLKNSEKALAIRLQGYTGLYPGVSDKATTEYKMVYKIYG